MIYGIRDNYPIKCSMPFYNAYHDARSVICNGLLIYGSAAETNLEKEKTEMAQRRNI